MVAGFGVDMPRFLHESPPPAAVVDVHAVVFTVWLLLLTAQVLLVVGDPWFCTSELGAKPIPGRNVWLRVGEKKDDSQSSSDSSYS
jgi:hypothetical protein